MPRSLWRKAVRAGHTRAFRTRSFGKVSSSPAVAVTSPSLLEAALHHKRITPAAGAVLPCAKAERNAATRKVGPEPADHAPLQRICYSTVMTREQIATILERVAGLPEEAHAELIESLAQIEAKYAGVYKLTEEERAALDRSFEDVQHGRFASSEKIEAILARYRG